METNQPKKNINNSINTPGSIQLSKIQMYNKLPKVSNFFRGELLNKQNNQRLSLDRKENYINNKLKEIETEINKPKLLTQFYPEAFDVQSKNYSKEKKTISSNKQDEKYTKVKIKKKSEERKKINNFFINEEINNQSLNDNNRLSDDNRYKKHIYDNKISIKKQLSEYDELKFFNTNNEENIFFKEKDKPKKITSENYFNKTNFYMNFSEQNQNNQRKCSDDIISNKNHNPYSLFIKNELKSNTNRNSSNKKVAYVTVNKSINNTNYENNAMNTYYNNIYGDGTGNNFFNTKTYTNNYLNKINETSDSIQDYYPRKVTKITNKNNINKLLLRPIIPNERKTSDDLEKGRFNSQYIINNNNNLKEKFKSDISQNIDSENVKILNDKNDGIEITNKKLNEFLLLNSGNKLKKEIENLDEGISFNFFNGYKYYFYIKNVEIYFLKEVKHFLAKGLSISIKNWNKENDLNDNYLKIIDHKNIPGSHCTYIIEYPRKGENLYNIINSIGFISKEMFFQITNKVYNCIMEMKEKNIELNKDYMDVPFCLCDIFYSPENNIKLMPPIIRKIPINSNDYFPKNLIICKCKQNYKILNEVINKNNVSFFCLGFTILQLITQNLIFEMKSYIIFINSIQEKEKEKIKKYKKCCLLHSLLFIEDKNCNNKNDILLSKFLNIFDYENKLEIFIHESTLFNDNNFKNPKNDFNYNNSSMLDLSDKELFKIINLSNNNYMSLESFLQNFNKLFIEININNEKNNYLNLLKENKIISVIKRYYSNDKDIFKNKIKDIILKKNNNTHEEKVNNFINKYYNFSSLK